MTRRRQLVHASTCASSSARSSSESRRSRNPATVDSDGHGATTSPPPIAPLYANRLPYAALLVTFTTRDPMENLLDPLCALHALGRYAWPAIDLDLNAFSAIAERCLRAGAVDDIRAGDLYLAAACAAGIDGAICAFDKH